MIGDIKLKYCPICDETTDHLQGCFKSKEIKGELFHLDVTLSDSLKKISAGFSGFLFEEKDGFADSNSPSEYASTENAGLNFEEMFATQVRSLKCGQCQHLIKLSRLP
jgi:hypothetical protein